MPPPNKTNPWKAIPPVSMDQKEHEFARRPFPRKGAAAAGPPPDQKEKCHICGTYSRFIGTFHGRAFLLCPHCDLIFVPKYWHLSARRQRSRYECHENSPDNAGYVARFERLLAAVRRCGHGIRQALDYGCGPGPVLVELMRAAGWDASGYDPFFAPDLDFTRRFDLITATETIEHFANPAQEIRRMASLLRARGYLAVMSEWHPGEAGFGDWWYARDPTHVAFYSHKTLDYLCEALGFRLLYHDEKNTAILQKT